MNKQGKGKIDWCDLSFNPITGCNGPEGFKTCPYCYAKSMAERFRGTPAFPKGFDPALHEDRLGQLAKVRGSKRIFVCSMADLFGRTVPDAWVVKVMNAIVASPHHTYILLTKNPGRMREYARTGGKANIWWGFSASNGKDYATRHEEMLRVPVVTRWASLEPLHEGFTPDLAGMSWVVVGAETGSRPGKVPIKQAWVDEIIRECRTVDETQVPATVAVFVKDNCMMKKPPREFPSGGK